MAGVSAARRLRERGVEDIMVVEATDRQCGPHSLVEVQRGSALIGRELHSVATPVSLMP